MLARRSFLALPALTLACSEEAMADRSHQMPKFGLPPWHIWGSSDVYTLRLGQGIALNNQSLTGRQLVKVNYGRPETWTFLFFVQVASLDANLAPVDVTVFYDLIVGIGRTSVKIPNFASILVPAALTPATAPTFYRMATQVEGDALNAAATEPNIISKFPAQDINIGYPVDFVGGPEPVANLRLTVSAYVAPRTHIRPDWYSEEFRGGEKGGT